MKILAIETSGDICGVALISKDRIISEKNVLLPKNSSSMIFEIIKEVSRKIDFDCLAVDIGPGSFTGIRIGVSLARAYGQFLKIPVIGVSSLDCLVYNALTKTKVCGKIYPVIDALREEVYTAGYDEFRRKTGYQIIKIERFKKMLGNKSTVVGNKEICKKISVSEKCFNTQLTASAVGFLAMKKLLKNQTKNYKDVLPLYIRRIFAEERIRIKKSAAAG